MKKFFKKILLALVLIPCMFAVACFGNDDDDDKFTQDGAYSTLRTNITSGKVVDNTKTHEITVNTVEGMTATTDFSQSGLNTTNLAMVQEYMDMDDENGEEKCEQIYGYKTDGTGYLVTKWNEGENGAMVVTKSEFTKKNGTNYENYKMYEGQEWDEDLEDYVDVIKKEIAYVGSDYAENTYVLKITEDEESMAATASLFDLIRDNETYTAFKTAADEWAEESVSKYTSAELGDGVTSTVSVDLKEVNEVCVLEVTINIQDIEMEIMGMAMNMDVAGTMTMNFTESGISKVAMDMDMTAVTEIGKDMLAMMAPDQATEFTNDNKVVINMNMDMLSQIEFNTGFDETILTASTEGYEGLGENGAIENLVFEYAPIVCATTGDKNWRTLQYGEVIDLDAADFGLANSTITLYWDEACTDAVEATDTYPSYPKTLYYKVTPNTGYALVAEKIYDNETGEFEYVNTYEHEVATGLYEVSYSSSSATVNKVEVNGVVNANYADGLTVEGGNYYEVKIYVTYNFN